jgi:predicted O-linked N-acetylglucosamine transferase (SPINDLY family)
VIAPLSRAEYGLPDKGFVFCCFNQAVKITPEIFACWMNLVRRVPHSVLWLAEDNPLATSNLSAAAREQGIAPQRLVFAPRLPYARHLARYRAADLALDTFPYTSHTTASDALWLGCPVVGLCGDTFAARVSGSILTACGLPELITHSLPEFEDMASRLASDPDFMRHIRARLSSAKAGAPLFDPVAYARDLERLYTNLAAQP